MADRHLFGVVRVMFELRYAITMQVVLGCTNLNNQTSGISISQQHTITTIVTSIGNFCTACRIPRGDTLHSRKYSQVGPNSGLPRPSVHGSQGLTLEEDMARGKRKGRHSKR